MKKFFNLKYGECFLLAESEDLYFVYTEATKAIGSYIVCTHIDSMDTLIGQTFFKNFVDAYKFYNSKQITKDKSTNKKNNF